MILHFFFTNFHRASSFYLPQDRSVPVVMIGPGTGVAPFRSFWQQAEYEYSLRADGSNLPMRDLNLYFGCRNSEHDDIYGEETKALVEKNILSSVRTAYSRQKNMPKVCFRIICFENLFANFIDFIFTLTLFTLKLYRPLYCSCIWQKVLIRILKE